MNVKPMLESHYRASLAMLLAAIEKSPDALWTSNAYANPCWQIAYHTLYYADLYLRQTAADFTPWDKHRPDHQDLRARPRQRAAHPLLAGRGAGIRPPYRCRRGRGTGPAGSDRAGVRLLVVSDAEIRASARKPAAHPSPYGPIGGPSASRHGPGLPMDEERAGVAAAPRHGCPWSSAASDSGDSIACSAVAALHDGLRISALEERLPTHHDMKLMGCGIVVPTKKVDAAAVWREIVLGPPVAEADRTCGQFG